MTCMCSVVLGKGTGDPECIQLPLPQLSCVVAAAMFLIEDNEI